MNFDALRHAPHESEYKNSLTYSYYQIVRAHGKKVVIVACIFGGLLLLNGQVIGVVTAIIWYVAYRISLRHSIESTIEQAQLSAFARDNGWQFTHCTKTIQRAGSLFENGAYCVIENHFVTPKFEVGQCAFLLERDKTETAYKVRHFFGLYLPKALPHLLVNAKDNQNDVPLSWLSHTDEKVSKLSLEGDFDRYFTLYAPRKYDTDARVIFSPDVMSALIRDAKHYDMEIIGDRMYFYCDTIDWLDEAFWQRVDNLATVVEKEIDRQAIHYTDEHDGQELEVAQNGMGLHMILDLPLWAKLWIGGIAIVMLVLTILIMLFPKLY